MHGAGGRGLGREHHGLGRRQRLVFALLELISIALVNLQQDRHAARVVIIVYNEADAVEVARLAPELMMSVSADRAGEIATLMARGVRADRMLGFTGTREPDRTLLNELRRVGVEPIVGTLGPAATRLDERYLADGNGSEYAELIRGGAAIIATDRPVEALAALKRAGRDGTRCLSVNPPR